MTFWILSALILYFVQTLLPVTFRYRGSPASFGPRDEIPDATPLALRSERALANAGEAMILFFPLALLTLSVEGATSGAAIFVLARIVYVPLYLFGVPYLRTLIWGVSLVGLVIMALAIGQ